MNVLMIGMRNCGMKALSRHLMLKYPYSTEVMQQHGWGANFPLHKCIYYDKASVLLDFQICSDAFMQREIARELRLLKMLPHTGKSAVDFQCIILVVDSSKAAMSELEDLAFLFNTFMEYVKDQWNPAVLVMAHKQDLPDCIELSAIAQTLQLETVCKGNNWAVMPTSLAIENSVEVALDWAIRWSHKFDSSYIHRRHCTIV